MKEQVEEPRTGLSGDPLLVFSWGLTGPIRGAQDWARGASATPEHLCSWGARLGTATSHNGSDSDSEGPQSSKRAVSKWVHIELGPSRRRLPVALTRLLG